MSASVKIDQSALKGLMASPQGPVWIDIQRRTNRVLNQARRNTPVDEGRLRASLAMEMRSANGSPVGRVGTNVEYALYVHEGTGVEAGRNYIVPVRARVLRWAAKNNSGGGARRYKGGATQGYVYAKRVRGVKARPFLRDALSAASQ